MPDLASLVSDGCTGFWWAQWIWDIVACCETHDFGGSDGTLLDCWTDNGMPIAFAAGAVFVMTVCRPVYHRIKKWKNGGE